MEARTITDNQIKASSKYYGQTAAFARLNCCPILQKLFLGWAAYERNTLTWLEIDFQNKHTVVTGVATQGGGRWSFSWHPMWVAKYKLQYGNDSGNLSVYMESDTKTEKVSELLCSA